MNEEDKKMTPHERLAVAEYDLETLRIQYAGAITAMASIIQELFSLEEFQDKVFDGKIDVGEWNLRVDHLDGDTFQVVYVGLAEAAVELIRQRSRGGSH